MSTTVDQNPCSSASLVSVFQEGQVGRIRLNRPKALNSLTLEMVRLIADALDAFEGDPAIGCILLDGEGSRGLCAGGDIRAIHESGQRQDGEAESFWREEYILNARIAAFPKPYIAIMDGITMGGGIGLAAHGSHRIVTERSRIAMPEVRIGFVPDVGGTWLLSRAPGELGTYLGLTGEIIGGGDAIRAGLADIMVPSERLSGMIDTLSSLGRGAAPDDIRGILRSYSRQEADEPLWQHRAIIDMCFAHDDIEAIVSSLRRATGEFAQKTLASLLLESPTSLKVSLRLLRLARNSSLEDCLQREFRAAVHCLREHDFYEGVRAAVIDKDRNPRWQPDSIEAVSAADVDHYLTPHHSCEPEISRRLES
jgi:enoyl-CoA hydratase